MRREKRIIPLCLCALVLFSLFLVPVSAANIWYDYGGKYFPEVPYVSISQYPYQFIAQAWYGDYVFLCFSSLPTISYSSYYVIDPSSAGYGSIYDSENFAWNELRVWGSNIALRSPVYIWANTDLYYNNQVFVSASQPQPITFPSAPVFSSNLERNKIYSYQVDQVATQLFVDASSSSGDTLVYQWQSYLNGSWASIANSSSDHRYFTPPTTVEGTFQYRCLVYYESFGTASGVSSNSVYVVVGSGTVPDDSVSVGDQVIIDQISGVQDSINDVKDSIDSVNDSLNATSPSLDSSIDDLEDASGTVDQFEDDQWSSINENIDDVTGVFDVFTNGSLAAAFGFLGGIVNNTFDSLGNWQVVITLPLALGLILYICSRAPLNSIPRIRDQAAAEVEAVKRADMRQSEVAYRKSYEYYRENRGRKESYSARYNAEMGRKKK